MKIITPHKFTFGPTKYSWAIENRLDDITDIKLKKQLSENCLAYFMIFVHTLNISK